MTDHVPVHFSITAEFIAVKDAFDILEPVGWAIGAQEDPLNLALILSSFSAEQAEAHALLWYRNEVDNGGHAQFFANVPSFLWSLAAKGFLRLGLEDLAENLRTTFSRMGETSLPDRERVAARLAELSAEEFGDQDEVFYEFERSGRELDQVVLEFIRSHPDAFLFEGAVMKVVD